MQTLTALVLTALLYLQPQSKTAKPIAIAIASEVSRACVEPGALGSCALDAVALGVSAYAEGGLCLGAACARGDHGHSSSTYGLMGYSPEEVALYESDLTGATHRAYVVLRASAAQCPQEPLAGYLGGCHRRGAVALARPRLELALGILEILQPEGVPDLERLVSREP